MSMAQLRLIKAIVFLSAFMTAMAFAGCKDVVITSHSVKGSEKTGLCFFQDSTYFISKNCQDLQCDFMRRLKVRGVKVSSEERPGAILCRDLKGIIEEVTLPGTKFAIKRCLFSDEKSFISLNLLESWDGKKFVGPSKPL